MFSTEVALWTVDDGVLFNADTTLRLRVFKIGAQVKPSARSWCFILPRGILGERYLAWDTKGFFLIVDENN
ncbi:MAG: hypothetical protein HON76_11855 [Candidatus Scalindua sp.]|nr:hypothetical protein [Candidatus Scalindua sp.]MBT5307358.1 hypothetical protein [Candidatus Scalindua sp.]MBT6230195.1 hypothetical protein [Candidatus Scalindua sp.]MBT6563206.1 hypothetical protein [Candidatus Scalindua sp.]MBT7212461.1 hypothetical protein [Candidatus Scalindua sp.]